MMRPTALAAIRGFSLTGVGVVATAETTKGLWHKAPGMITAAAALITAIDGLLGILIQNDAIGWGRDEHHRPSVNSGSGM